MFALDDGWAAKLGSTLASLIFLWTMIRQHLPMAGYLDRYFSKYTSRLMSRVYPYVRIKFPEHTGERLKRSEAYTAIQDYLSNNCSANAKNLKAEFGKDSTKLDLSMDDHEEVTDEFRGVKVWWASRAVSNRNGPPSFSYYPVSDEKRYYRLTFHLRDRDLVHGAYLQHVMEEGKAVRVKKRQRKLYTNNTSDHGYSWRSSQWSHVPFEHPATFATLAMDPEKKREIVDDLITFTRSKDYYSSIGKAWKRGYLLYGPPGTGKSSMVAAIANLLDYDVYDVELTAVKNNTALRKLLIETTSKSVIVMEDIDCSIDLTGKRKKKGGDGGEKEGLPVPPREEREDSKVTLSGLLNFIDGLWSSCGGEKIIVFTTNHVEKLDPALIRRGRMDKHIELSYCGFEAFKVLAKNYLGVETHELFGRVKELIEEVKITPADVAENLMPKVKKGKEEEATACLEDLIKALEDAKLKAKEEAEAAAKAAEEEKKREKLESATAVAVENEEKKAGEGEDKVST